MNGSFMMDRMKKYFNEQASGTAVLERVETGPGLIQPLEGEFIAKNSDGIIVVLDSLTDMKPDIIQRRKGRRK